MGELLKSFSQGAAGRIKQTAGRDSETDVNCAHFFPLPCLSSKKMSSSKALSVTEIDLDKLHFLPSKNTLAAIPAVKRNRIDDKNADSILVLCYNGEPITSLQFGRLSATSKPTDALACWRGMQYYDSGTKKFATCKNMKDVEWTKSLQRTAGKKITSKLLLNVQLGNTSDPSSEGAAAQAFAERVEQLIVEAYVKGVKLPDGTMHVIPKPMVKGVPIEVSEGATYGMIKGGILSMPPAGSTYDPQIRFRNRIFVDEEKGVPSGLATTFVAFNFADTDDTTKKLKDPIEFFAHNAVDGAWIVTPSVVDYSRKNEIFFSLDLHSARIKPLTNSTTNDSNIKD